ncbi:MAG: hypothetical protein HYZ13_01680 [Acidobacteria bacterium]|nr:hypothetical protein [Acidobacteriota bacterium]
MDLIRTYGAHRLTWVQDLGEAKEGGSTFHLMRRESDAARFLLQLWAPRMEDRTLDHLREIFLSRFQDATPMDPVEVHFGFDEEQVWFLQNLPGTPLARAWEEWNTAQRHGFQRHLEGLLATDNQARYLHPEVIGLRPGLITLPRALGEDPGSLAPLRGLLSGADPGPGAPAPLPWESPQILSQPRGRAIRGRSQELTYLKSLMLGLSAPTPMERIVLLMGEEGLGKEHLAAWACAAAESEGLWVHTLALGHEEGPSHLIQHLLEETLHGLEADLYARQPTVARLIARRLPAFAFLTGGRKAAAGDLDPEELQGALEALDFATTHHPRLVHLWGLDRAQPETLALIRELVHRSTLPWLLSLSSGSSGSGLKPLVAQLKGEPHAAIVLLNRLEDEDMRQVLQDLLGHHEIPQDVVQDLLQASLGNPGLMQSLVELAQQAGELREEAGQWALVAGQRPTFRAGSDLMSPVLVGRLHRLNPATQALVRLLALADRALPVEVLGRALGLAGDPLEDILQGAVGSKLVLAQGLEAQIPDPRWRELVLTHTPQPELKRLARALVGALKGAGDRGPISVSLQSLAGDEQSALSGVLQVLEREGVGTPVEVRRVVDQALALHPSPLDKARLFEHLADAWSHTTGGGLFTNDTGGAAPLPQALAALAKARAALAELPSPPPPFSARLLRKQAMLELRRRHLPEAREAIMAAADLLKEAPQHPEQPRIRLALARLHLLQGHLPKGIKALEEGLALLQSQGTKAHAVDQVELMLELGRALGNQSQMERATSLLESALRLAESGQQVRSLVQVQLVLSVLRMAKGDMDGALALLREALQAARLHGDPLLQAQAHLHLGMAKSLQHHLAPALSHLERAVDRFQRAGEEASATLARMWRARTLAALGDRVSAEHHQLQALGGQRAQLTPLEQGIQAFLQAEIAGFGGSWRDAARLYRQAAQLYEGAGLVWRHRLAQLRMVQAEARECQDAHREAPESCWSLLESLKGPVEGAGSRWLDLEWQRAHGLLLACAPPSDPVDQEALGAWGEAMTLARDLQFASEVLEAASESARTLLRRGERLGAMSRLQDAFPSFQQVWNRVGELFTTPFLGRPDLHRFQEAVTASGLKFVLPERGDPLADWTPTQANLPAVNFPER